METKQIDGPITHCQLSGRYCPSLDAHHSIPREYGGDNSPLIYLAPDIHQMLHRSVNNLQLRDEFLSLLPIEGRKKAVMLLELIEKAEAAGLKEKKETVSVKLEVPRKLYERLQVIATECKMTNTGHVILSILERTIKN